MVYLIMSLFEIEGHAISSIDIVEGESSMKTTVANLLADSESEDNYPIDRVIKEEDNSTTLCGEWSCGRWSINISSFKSKEDIVCKGKTVQTD